MQPWPPGSIATPRPLLAALEGHHPKEGSLEAKDSEDG